MSHNAKVVLAALAMIVLILLAGTCAYSAGEWIGKH
jgi:hypothetical protein